MPVESLAPERWRADAATLPAVSFSRSPGTLAAGLVVASALLALLGVWLIWRLLRQEEVEAVDEDEAPEARATPLERALQLAREASLDGDSPERRKAFERVARELGARGLGDLADRARALAWSSGTPSAVVVDELEREALAATTGASRDRRAPPCRAAHDGRARARGRLAADVARPARLRRRSARARRGRRARVERLGARPTSYFASGGGGVVVLDLSTSVEPRKYQRIQRVLRSLSQSSTRLGLVVFSDVAYEMFPSGTRGNELDALLPFFEPPPELSSTRRAAGGWASGSTCRARSGSRAPGTRRSGAGRGSPRGWPRHGA